MTRPARTLPLAALLAAMALGGCGNGDGATDTASGGAENEYRHPIAASEIRRRDLSRQLSTSAVVEPYSRTRLASRISGNIDEVLVETGDFVERDQVLARLDMSEQSAELARIEAELEQARRAYERAQALRARGAMSAADYETARLAVHVAERNRELWQTRIGFGEIKAPMDAVVTARHVEPGEGVQAQDPLFDLTAMDLLVMRIGISEMDVIHLEPGQTAPILLDARPGEHLEGTIRRIFPTAEPDTRLITVEIALPEGSVDRGIRPGFLGRVRMAIDPRPDVIAAPVAALGEEDGEHFLFVVTNNRLERRVVERGVQRGDWVEITSGLEEGEVVLATNPSELSDGQAVRIVGWRG
jgi:membrane fusion protein (multidrug efflux system)